MQKTVLLVDDDALSRMLTAFILRDLDMKIIETYSADRALAILENRRDIDIVVTDVIMPGDIDGLALVDEIRARWPHIRFIVVSGQVSREDGDLPDDGRFLAKPLKEAALRSAVVELAALH